MSGAVSQVDDKSVSGWDITQATAGDQFATNATTVNSLNVLDLDGSDEMDMPAAMRAIGNAANTVIMAYKNASTGTNAMPWFIGNGGTSFGDWRQVIQFEGAFNNVRFNQAASVQVSGMSIGANNTTAIHVTGMKFNGTNSIYKFFDGSLVTDTDSSGVAVTGSCDTGMIGNTLNGNLLEIAVYSRELTDLELNTFGAGMVAKWGAPWTDI